MSKQHFGHRKTADAMLDQHTNVVSPLWMLRDLDVPSVLDADLKGDRFPCG
jgi:hypothetical protein